MKLVKTTYISHCSSTTIGWHQTSTLGFFVACLTNLNDEVLLCCGPYFYTPQLVDRRVLFVKALMSHLQVVIRAWYGQH